MERILIYSHTFIHSVLPQKTLPCIKHEGVSFSLLQFQGISWRRCAAVLKEKQSIQTEVLGTTLDILLSLHMQSLLILFITGVTLTTESQLQIWKSIQIQHCTVTV